MTELVIYGVVFGFFWAVGYWMGREDARDKARFEVANSLEHDE